MLELLFGAKVIQSSAVQTAMIYNIPLEIKSTFSERDGLKYLIKRIMTILKVLLGSLTQKMTQNYPYWRR